MESRFERRATVKTIHMSKTTKSYALFMMIDRGSRLPCMAISNKETMALLNGALCLFLSLSRNKFKNTVSGIKQCQKTKFFDRK